jgi:DNA repair protein RadD
MSAHSNPNSASKEIVLREYQEKGVQANLEMFGDRKSGNMISVYPTGAGKSVVIAETVKRLSEPTLILQPSMEILEQNFEKYRQYGFPASIYSASLKQKVVSSATFGTIGSVVRQPNLFKDFKQVIIDECHLVNAKTGMYKWFLSAMQGTKVLGLTATPYRLSTSSFGTMLKFLTRTNPRIFSEVNYWVQVKELMEQGYLQQPTYHDIHAFEREKAKVNSTGTDFDQSYLHRVLTAADYTGRLNKVMDRLVEKRPSILVFTQFVGQAVALSQRYPSSAVVTAETPTKERNRIFSEWRGGSIQTLANVGIATTGVDYPLLSTVVDAAPTRSLSRYYQKLGRGIRPHPDKKDFWYVDLSDSTSYFGKVEDLHLSKTHRGLWEITSNGKPLTNVAF